MGTTGAEKKTKTQKGMAKAEGNERIVWKSDSGNKTIHKQTERVLVPYPLCSRYKMQIAKKLMHQTNVLQ